MPELVVSPPALQAGQISAGTTVGVLWRQAERTAERTLLHFNQADEWRTLSWRQTCDTVVRIAAGLLAHDVQPGERVVIMAENRPEWILADFAIQLIGGITVPIYPTLAPANAAEIAIDSGARLAVVADAQRPALAGTTMRLLSIDTDVPDWMARPIDESARALIAGRASALAAADVATIIYTSGTTGSPKGVVLSQESIVTMAIAGARALGLRSDDVLLSFLPYSHVFERVEGLMAPISAGAEIWISRGAQALASDLQAARPTLMLLVPRVLEKMETAIEDALAKRRPVTRLMIRAALAAGRRAATAEPASTASLSFRLADAVVLRQLRTRLTGGRLRFMVSGGAPLLAGTESFFWSIGLPVYQGWGLTETCAAAAANRPGAVRHGTVGQPLPNVEIKAAADGELLVKGPGVMRGYFNQPEASDDVLSDGWLKTGDIGAIDAEGYVTITDRKKDLIKTSTGKYIAPQPVEAQLQSFRYIAVAVLVGDQRPYVVALVQPAWDEIRRELKVDGSIDQLAADDRVEVLVKRAVETINRRLANFESIKRFRILATEFSEANGELTPSLKVRRRLVQRRYQQLIDEMYGVR